VGGSTIAVDLGGLRHFFARELGKRATDLSLKVPKLLAQRHAPWFAGTWENGSSGVPMRQLQCGSPIGWLIAHPRGEQR